MSTAAQINANQLNAQSSTGPRTAEGKSTVSKNATKHGLTATYPVIRTPDEQTQFDEMSAAFLEELRPYTPSEQTQFKQLILAAWNIDRCHRLEAEIAAACPADPLLDDELAPTLARINTYRLRAERVFHKSHKELKSRPAAIRAAAGRPVQHVQNEPKYYGGYKETYIRPTPKVGRNEPCPCASGRKFKHCCLQNEPNLAKAA